jgi:diguanylate cyclase (GGDEF)-like protein
MPPATMHQLDAVKQVPHIEPMQVLATQQRVLTLLAGNSPLHEVLGEIARFAEACIPGMSGSILYYDPRARRLRRGGYGRLPDSFAAIVDGLVPGPAAGSCGTCAYLNERVISEDVFTDPLWAGFHDLCQTYQIRSAWSSPLRRARDGELLGVFGMYHAEPRVPSAEELQLVDYFVHLASIAAERYRDDADKAHAATHDPLTGLGNRRLLESLGASYLAQRLEAGNPVTLAFLDLDKFKTFNEAFGHLRGDQLLVAFSQRLQACLPDSGPQVRFGGDEFVVFLPCDPDTARLQLDALRASLRREPLLADHSVRLTVSCGIQSPSPECTDLSDLLLQADHAVRRAKAQGGDSCVRFTGIDSGTIRRRRELAVKLENAIAQREIAPFLQPVVRLEDDRPAGFELLFRTSAPSLAGCNIAECISVAEEYGLIGTIGQAILRYAMQLVVQERVRLEGMVLNVNVSVMQLLRPEFLADVQADLRETGADAQRICIEITESQWLDVGGPARDTLLGLHELGFHIALDDFGTGYASLAYLQALPLDTIKVDRRFTAGVHEQRSRDAGLCRAMLGMGQAAGLRVVAEGVELPEQALALRDMGYELAQGFLWQRPMPAAQALAWLDSLVPSPVAMSA